MERKIHCANALVAVLAALTPSVGVAQNSNGLNEIVVTAQRREQNQQNVPIAVATISDDTQRKWFHYLMCFIGAVFVANFFPHFLHGTSGVEFPTPFANPPPPIGRSSAFLNTWWALINLAVGYVLLRFGRFSVTHWRTFIVAFCAFALMSVAMAKIYSAIPHP